MNIKKQKIRIGIVGCGAIGSRIAKSIQKELRNSCRITGLFDTFPLKARGVAKKLHLKSVVKPSLKSLISCCDFVVEAVSSDSIEDILRLTLQAKKDILVMSVGKLLKVSALLKLARKNRCTVLLPSGAIGGLDAIKAVGQTGIKTITLITRKPPTSIAPTPYLARRGIDLQNIKKETVLFSGRVKDAVRYFPQNINVAATLAFASQAENKIRIRLIASPRFKCNSHEIIASGSFGKIITRTENAACPDNPKTSYLAVLSGIQALKQHFDTIKIGT